MSQRILQEFNIKNPLKDEVLIPQSFIDDIKDFIYNYNEKSEEDYKSFQDKWVEILEIMVKNNE